SGILSIAALLLGAQAVTACDIDTQALQATRDNAAANGIGNQLAITQDAGIPAGNFDIVVANIVSGTLIAHADRIAGHISAGGRLLLSGILEEQVVDVTRAYGDYVAFD